MMTLWVVTKITKSGVDKVAYFDFKEHRLAGAKRAEWLKESDVLEVFMACVDRRDIE